jgi:hypothetical protein
MKFGRTGSILAIKAVVSSAIQLNHSLEYVDLQLEDGVTDEGGIAWAEALTNYKILLYMHTSRNEHNQAALGPQSCVRGIWYNT